MGSGGHGERTVASNHGAGAASGTIALLLKLGAPPLTHNQGDTILGLGSEHRQLAPVTPPKRINKSVQRLLISAWVLTGAVLAQSPAPRGLLDQYCVGCHNDRLKTGGLSFQKIDVTQLDQNAEVWEKVVHIVRAGLMPPAGLPRPDRDTMNRFAATIETGIDRVALAHPNPGRLGLHRLNRTEYSNVVRDMLGLEINSKAYLPPDETSNGFDNMTETLNISPALMEGDLRVAARISRDAVGDARISTQEQTYHLSRSYTQRDHVDGTPFGTRGGIAVRHIFPADGEYVFKVAFHMAEQGMLWGETLGPGEQVEIAINGTRVALLDVDPKINDNSPPLATPRIKVKAGPQMVSASFLVKSDAANGDLVEQHQRSIVDLSAGMTPGVTTEPHLKDLAISGPSASRGRAIRPAGARFSFAIRPTPPASYRARRGSSQPVAPGLSQAGER